MVYKFNADMLPIVNIDISIYLTSHMWLLAINDVYRKCGAFGAMLLSAQ